MHFLLFTKVFMKIMDIDELIYLFKRYTTPTQENNGEKRYRGGVLIQEK